MVGLVARLTQLLDYGMKRGGSARTTHAWCNWIRKSVMRDNPGGTDWLTYSFIVFALYFLLFPFAFFAPSPHHNIIQVKKLWHKSSLQNTIYGKATFKGKTTFKNVSSNIGLSQKVSDHHTSTESNPYSSQNCPMVPWASLHWPRVGILRSLVCFGMYSRFAQPWVQSTRESQTTHDCGSSWWRNTRNERWHQDERVDGCRRFYWLDWRWRWW